MKAAFYDLEEWQTEYLSARLSGVEAAFHSGQIGEELDPETEALSVFIYSAVDRAVLDRLPKLKFVCTRSTGFDHIDLAACKERGIPVSNVPHYGENTVAEHTFALILALSRKVHQAWVRTQRHDFSTQGLRGFDLKGKCLGVVGAGNIGLHVIRIARGFGMEVLAYDARPQPLLAEVLGFRYASLEEIFQGCQVVSLHLPHRPDTVHLINRELLARMQRGSVLINTARGEVVDTEALIWALDTGILSGAGLDVLEGEGIMREEHALPAEASHEQLRSAVRNFNLLGRDNVVITPHVAFYSHEAEQRILDTTLENLAAFQANHSLNTVGG